MKRSGKEVTAAAALLLAATIAGCGDPDKASMQTQTQDPTRDGGTSATPGSVTLPGAPSLPGQVASPINGTSAADGGAPAVDTGSPTPVTSCSLDTHAIVHFQGRLVETFTKAGKLFTFEPDGTPWASNGADLTSVKYYADGPCSGKAAGSCRFDTQAYALIGGRLLEFITAYGKHWTFEGTTATDKGTSLVAIQRYADACAARGAGDCVLDTRTFVEIDGKLAETITAYGKTFQYAADGTRAPTNGRDLTTIAHYAAGPCAGKGLGRCRFDTRTFGVMNDQVVEIVVADGKVWRFVAGGPSAFTAVAPSNVPVSTQSPWSKGPCN